MKGVALKKAPFGKNRCWLLVCACFLVTGCIGEVLTTIPVLNTSDKGASVPASWSRYGAYYVADDLILSVNNDPYRAGSKTEYTVFKRIRILNQQGTRFATIVIPRYSQDIELFEITVLTADSVSVPVQEIDIRRKYEETGKVVVPQAAAGTLISVKIVFSAEKAQAVFEHWFLEPIPVLTGRFAIHQDEGVRFTYDYETHGTRTKIDNAPVRQNGGTSTAWEVKNLEPFDSVSFRPIVSETEPRVALRASPLYDANHDPVTSWQSLTRWMGGWRIDPALFGSSDAVDEKVKEIVAGVHGDSARTEAIAAWLQKNIICQRRPMKGTIGDVLKTSKSDYFLVGLLCREMLKSCGIHSEVILTRNQDFGGFDSSFLSYLPCQDGIVVVRLNGRDRCVTPVFTQFPVGAYPVEYFGLSGLNIDQGKIEKLAPPLWNSGTEFTKATLDFGRDSALQAFHAEIGELSTVATRRMLVGKSESEQRSIVEKIVRARRERTAVVSCVIKNLHDLHAPIVIDAGFRDNCEPEEIAGSFRYDLTHCFPRFFAGIDSARREDISVKTPWHNIDTIEILKSPALSVAIDAAPWKAKNALFDASVKIVQTDSLIMVIRDVDRHAGVVPASNIPSLIPDIEGLDRAGKIAAVITKRK